jgi:hypothetical protein
MNPIEQEIADSIASGEVSPEEALAAVEQLMSEGVLDETLTQMSEEDAAAFEKKEAEERRMRLSVLGRRLHSEAQEQVQLRQQTEERWYQDVRQFNGQYDPGMFGDGDMYGSRVFVPLTRRLVNLCEARLFDMVFQSDRRFFVTEPTPVPDLGKAEGYSETLPADHPIKLPGGQQATAGDIATAIKTLIEEAKTKNDAMQREIDDQLAECRFPQQARDAIHDAILLGTGVLKGPSPLMKTVKRWNFDEATQSHTLLMEERPVPVTVRVDLWNFFPDMSATTIGDCERVWERHYLTKRQVADLKNMPGSDKDALREILGGEPSAPTNNYRERLRSINGASGAPDKRYEIWEYHGPITAQDLIDCGCEEDVGEDADPLDQYTGTVWFCEGTVFKASLNPLDSGELPYRVFTWQKDESSIFGFGLPYEVRDQQVSANSSWRAMLDNMGLCVKPQVIIDDQSVEPIVGGYDLSPGKFWRNKRPGSDGRQGIQFVNIDSRLQELQAIFTASKTLIEEVGTMPGFMQGQDAPAKMQSATEASISWTAANLWVRRCVRDWDDDIITPTISAYYDWNMQYSEKAEIKGDSKVRALGTSYLAELEGQAAKMQTLAQAASAMGLPLSTNYAMLRELSRSLKLDPDRWLPSEQEITQMREAEKQQGPKPDPEAMKLEAMNKATEAKVAVAQINAESRANEIAQRERSDQNRLQIEIADTAAKERITGEQAAAKYIMERERIGTEMQDRAENRAHKSQMLNAEMELKARLGSGI